MATARDKIAHITGKVAENQAQLKTVDAVFKFVLDGEDGGTWIMDLRESPKVVEEDGEAQCTIRMSAQDFVDIFDGSANAQQLFFMGRLRIEGDMGLAMKLQPVIEMLK